MRLYGFLCALKASYKRITVGGNLLREDFPYLQHASGEWFWNFKVRNDHTLVDLRSLIPAPAALCASPIPIRGCILDGGAAAFHWKQCGQTTFLCRFFFIMTMWNMDCGTGKMVLSSSMESAVWHKGFECAFAGTTRYYDVRNTLIAAALYQPEQRPFAIKKWVCRNIISPIWNFGMERLFVLQRAGRFLQGAHVALQAGSGEAKSGNPAGLFSEASG